MEDMSLPVAVTLSLDSPICDSSGPSGEITRLKVVADAASLLSDPAVLLQAADKGDIWDEKSRDDINKSVFSRSTDTGKWPQMANKTQDNGILDDVIVQESEEEILLVGRSYNGIDNERLLPVPFTSDCSSLPIAVKVEGFDDGQIIAKVITAEERCDDKKLDVDVVANALNPIEGNSSKPTLKSSVVALKLPNEENPVKGSLKNIYELDYVPLWGSTTACGMRPEMEDAIMAAPYFTKIPIEIFMGDHSVDGISLSLTHLTSHFFGVYDGHGGSQVANYCRERVHMALDEVLKAIGDDCVDKSLGDTLLKQWEKIFTSCFFKVDDEVGGKITRPPCYTSEPVASETVGSTAVVAVVCSSHIVVANCGDSRAVLYRGKRAVALSIDHKPNRDDEYARIEASGGKVIQWNGHRVFGVLAMSRSIGDRYLKPWIIPDPEVMLVPRAKEDECLILASDGLWDVMTNEEVCEVARRRLLLWHKNNGKLPLPERGLESDPAAKEAAEYLTNLALNKGSKDNIAIIVIDLKARRKFKTKS